MPDVIVRTFFNTHHDQRGRFGTGGGISGPAAASYKGQRDILEKQAEDITDELRSGHPPPGTAARLAVVAKAVISGQPKVGDTILVHHRGKLRPAKVHEVGLDFSVKAKLHGGGGEVHIRPMSHKALQSLSAYAIATFEDTARTVVIHVR